MKERFERLKAVRGLIKAHRIDSQETLLQLLQEAGYSVTQATLSRDLKFLKVGKVSDGHSGYYYTVPSDEERRESERHYIQDFLRGYVSIDWNSEPRRRAHLLRPLRLGSPGDRQHGARGSARHHLRPGQHGVHRPARRLQRRRPRRRHEKEDPRARVGLTHRQNKEKGNRGRAPRLTPR